MKSLLTILTLLVAMLTAGNGFATIPELWGVWSWPHTEPVHIMVTPGADGDALESASLMGGAVVDATILIQLWASGGGLDEPLPPQPVAYFPFEDLWLEAPGLANCTGGASADGNTDAEGWFTFSGSPNMGGANDPDAVLPGLQVMVSGTALDDQVNPIRPHILVNSPDINGDGTVSLTDVPLFAADFYGPYAFRSDFSWDGAINLSDVVRLATSLGESCP